MWGLSFSTLWCAKVVMVTKVVMVIMVVNDGDQGDF